MKGYRVTKTKSVDLAFNAKEGRFVTTVDDFKLTNFNEDVENGEPMNDTDYIYVKPSFKTDSAPWPRATEADIILIDHTGNEVPGEIVKQWKIPQGELQKAVRANLCFKISRLPSAGGKNTYKIFTKTMYAYDAAAKAHKVNKPVNVPERVTQIRQALSLRPENVIISDSNWKYLIRSVLAEKNICFTGPTGAGKTRIASAAAAALNRPFFKIDMGSTQDPRVTLIGNTSFQKDVGTIFNESNFVKAIRTPNAIILLDELSRAHPEAHNILMPVLDPTQRHLCLDEHNNHEIISVAPGVCFIATANIGVEYTATRVLDRAMRDRFMFIEMSYLTQYEEGRFLKICYPDLHDDAIAAIAGIATMTREELKKEDSRIQTAISTRLTREMAEAMLDGFTFQEAAEACVIPFFSTDGGNDSERTFIRQALQKFDLNMTAY